MSNNKNIKVSDGRNGVFNLQGIHGKKVVGYFWMGSKKHNDYIVIYVTYIPSFWHRVRMFIAGYNFKRLNNNQ